MGWIRDTVSAWLSWLMGHERRYRITLGYHSAIPLTNNRNQIVKEFLESSDDYLLMMDNDIAPHTNLLDMVKEDLDVVGYPCPIWRDGEDNPDGPITWNLFPLELKGKVPLGSKAPPLIEVIKGGTGAILIARRVLEHFDMRAPFMDVFDEDGIRILGSDYSFCLRAREAGFRVWVAARHPCGHVKDRDLFQIIQNYWVIREERNE